MRSRLIALCTLLFTGCANPSAVEVSVVMTHGNCQQAKEGVTRVTFAEVAALRGAQLLGFESAEPADNAQQDDLVLVAISTGDKPTAGYSLELTGEPTVENGVLTLNLRILSPAKDAMLAQMVTRPCLVVGLPPSGYERLRVVDETGREIGALTR